MHGLDAQIFSTDDYWYARSEDGKTYRFDVTYIKEAHEWNQARVRNFLSAGGSPIVDNTNLDSFAVSPYFDMALEVDLTPQIIEVETDIDTCLERNAARSIDRQVSEYSIRKMRDKMNSIQLDADTEMQKARLRSQLRMQKS
jgi:predicted kinase